MRGIDCKRYFDQKVHPRGPKIGFFTIFSKIFKNFGIFYIFGRNFDLAKLGGKYPRGKF